MRRTRHAGRRRAPRLVALSVAVLLGLCRLAAAQSEAISPPASNEDGVALVRAAQLQHWLGAALPLETALCMQQVYAPRWPVHDAGPQTDREHDLLRMAHETCAAQEQPGQRLVGAAKVSFAQRLRRLQRLKIELAACQQVPSPEPSRLACAERALGRSPESEETRWLLGSSDSGKPSTAERAKLHPTAEKMRE